MTEATHSDDDALEAFRNKIRKWVELNVPPAPSFALPQSFLEVETVEQFDYLRAFQKKLFAARFLGYDVPKEYGGQGIDLQRQAIVMAELARAGAPFMVNTIGLRWVVPTILKFGTEAQKQKFIKPILSTEHIWCQGFSEPEAGSDLASLQTRARAEGDQYRVTGHKVWTTIARFSDYMILLARTDMQANKYAGLSYFLFPMKSPEVSVVPLIKMSGEGGFHQVLFDDAPMPNNALLGQEGQGWQIAMATLTFERRAVGGEQSASIVASFDRLIALARERNLGTGNSVWAHRLADLWIAIEATRLGERRSKVAGLQIERPTALEMMSKLARSELEQRVAELACQLLGADARLWHNDPDAPDGGQWPRAYMNSFGFTIGGGTSEIQRNLLAERVLGLARSR